MSVFTSDLSVADFALCHRLSLQPISQVLGTSIYQVGYQPAWPGFGVEREMGELQVLSQAWNEARDLALSRIVKEAEEVGASAVVGVDIRSGSSGVAAGAGVSAIEYTVLGTAVRRKQARPGPPVLTELSVADYSKLIEAGIEPVGVVAWTSVFFVGSLYIRSEQQLSLGSSFRNYEMEGVTQCFYSARERVMEKLGRQASALGASGIVGMRIGHSAAPQKIGGGALGEQERTVVMVTMSAIGTAICERAGGADAHASTTTAAAGPPRPQPTIDLLS